MILLETKKLTKYFRGLRALDQVDLEVRQGEIFGLIGPNGSGKSTLVNVVTGFLKPTAGHIRYKGKEITGRKQHEIAKRGIRRTFQHTSLFPDLTLGENVICGKYLNTSDDFLGAFFRTKGYHEREAKLRQEVMQIPAFAQFRERTDMVARNLPAAQQRVLEIAISLAGEPELLLLDEPVAGMNRQEVQEVVKLLRSIWQLGTTLVIIEHNMRVVMELCSHVVVLNQGVKIADGTPEEVVLNDQVVSVYLGRQVQL